MATWHDSAPMNPLDADAERLAAQGLRVMAFASRAWPQLPAEPADAPDLYKTRAKAHINTGQHKKQYGERPPERIANAE